MKPFDYILPATLDAATAALAKYNSDARVLAGGTDLLIELRRTAAKSPRAVIDINRLKDLGGITESDDEIHLNPLSTHAEVCSSEVVRRHAPLLAMAASTIGSLQIRHRATVGGNIMNAAACADMVPPLVALGARVILQSSRESRECELSEFFLRPYQTVARPDEILTRIQFPKLNANAHSAFRKLGRRNAVAISRLSVAAVVERDARGNIFKARIVPGAAFPTWGRAREAERMLFGQVPSAELFAAAGRKVSELMISLTGRRWSTEYKEPVIAVLVRRVLEMCCEMTPERL